MTLVCRIWSETFEAFYFFYDVGWASLEDASLAEGSLSRGVSSDGLVDGSHILILLVEGSVSSSFTSNVSSGSIAPHSGGCVIVRTIPIILVN